MIPYWVVKYMWANFLVSLGREENSYWVLTQTEYSPRPGDFALVLNSCLSDLLTDQ